MASCRMVKRGKLKAKYLRDRQTYAKSSGWEVELGLRMRSSVV
jgi:hypothetical protein